MHANVSSWLYVYRRREVPRQLAYQNPSVRAVFSCLTDEPERS